MAICPVCGRTGGFCGECPDDHHYFVDESAVSSSGGDPMIGSLIGGQYIPTSLIGEGGMGRIYRARGRFVGRDVALKVLKSEYMDDETLKERFFREAEVVARLNHPNIVSLYGCAPEPAFNTIFMAMELLEGRTFAAALSGPAVSFGILMGWFEEIALALGEAHRHGVFHRDLKPENVFLIKDGGAEHVRVLDFGFARLENAAKKLTMGGVAFGTPHYMSPEQAMGLTDMTAAVDIYAIGIMMFQAISGRLPFDGAGHAPMEIMRAQVYEAAPVCVPRSEYAGLVPPGLLECVRQCMSKDPTWRYPDGDALYAELMAIKSGRRGTSRAVASAAPRDDDDDRTVVSGGMMSADDDDGVETRLDTSLEEMMRLRSGSRDASVTQEGTADGGGRMLSPQTLILCGILVVLIVVAVFIAMKWL